MHKPDFPRPFRPAGRLLRGEREEEGEKVRGKLAASSSRSVCRAAAGDGTGWRERKRKRKEKKDKEGRPQGAPRFLGYPADVAQLEEKKREERPRLRVRAVQVIEWGDSASC